MLAHPNRSPRIAPPENGLVGSTASTWPIPPRGKPHVLRDECAFPPRRAGDPNPRRARPLLSVHRVEAGRPRRASVLDQSHRAGRGCAVSAEDLVSERSGAAACRRRPRRLNTPSRRATDSLLVVVLDLARRSRCPPTPDQRRGALRPVAIRSIHARPRARPIEHLSTGNQPEIGDHWISSRIRRSVRAADDLHALSSCPRASCGVARIRMSPDRLKTFRARHVTSTPEATAARQLAVDPRPS